MGLKIIDEAVIEGVSGSDTSVRGKADVALAVVSMEDKGVEIPSRLVVANFNSLDPACNLLLGRPFLRWFDLSYEGATGRFTLVWAPPSELNQQAT